MVGNNTPLNPSSEPKSKHFFEFTIQNHNPVAQVCNPAAETEDGGSNAQRQPGLQTEVKGTVGNEVRLPQNKKIERSLEVELSGRVLA